jgi:hypothetical protein
MPFFLPRDYPIFQEDNQGFISPSSGNRLERFSKSEQNVSLLENELCYFSSCIFVTLAQLFSQKWT